ncbi:MAG: hypothetical protein WD534_04745 [Phycisphaeraceae bacterium]
MRMSLVLVTVGLCLLVGSAREAAAQADGPAMGYHVMPVEEAGQALSWRPSRRGMRPYAVVDGPGRAVIWIGQPRWDQPEREVGPRLAVRAPLGEAVTGTVYVPNPDLDGMRAVPFEIAADALTDEPGEEYHEVIEAHYRELWQADLAGGAWFRHQMGAARAAQGLDPAATERNEWVQTDWRQRNAMAETYALYSGARATSENLQLDDFLRVGDDGGEATVDVESLTGITVEPVDWAALIEDLEPANDPLANRIPADQYAIFLPDLAASRRLLTELEQQLLPMLHGTQPESASLGLAERYVRQMALPLSELEGVAEAAGVRAVAITGSDPYWLSGTDVAVMFEVENAQPLLAVLSEAQREAAAATGVEIQAIPEWDHAPVHDVARTEDRQLSSYVVQLDEQTVVVANSLTQAQRIGEVVRGEREAMGELDEHTFMAARYPYRDGEATAVVMITDDAIRKWGSGRWRIAASRRIRALARMQEHKARHFDRIVNEVPFLMTVMQEPAEPDARELTFDGVVTADGIRSTTYNTPTFLTPIAELELDLVTEAEADAYRTWRNRYENRWQAFDPIGLSLTLTDERVAMDLTVLPLIRASEYRQMVQLAGDAEIDVQTAAGHDEAIARFVMAVDMDAPELRQARGMAQMMGLGADPLAWVGETVSVYADADPVWEQILTAESMDDAMEEHLDDLPIAVEVAVQDRLRLAGFLVGLRGVVQQTAPDMTVWENFEHAGSQYVRVTAEMDDVVDERDDLSLYYAVGDTLTATLSESLIHRTLARQANEADEGPADGDVDWLGRHMALRLRGPAFALLSQAGRSEQMAAAQVAAWRYLPILNEWRQRYPDRDPLDVHEAFTGQRPRDPAGGTYVWNEQWQTMASTVYGHPGEPAEGPVLTDQLRQLREADFGVTFEHDGLRARTILHRTEPTE